MGEKDLLGEKCISKGASFSANHLEDYAPGPPLDLEDHLELEEDEEATGLALFLPLYFSPPSAL